MRPVWPALPLNSWWTSYSSACELSIMETLHHALPKTSRCCHHDDKSPQPHYRGIVHAQNLCASITLRIWEPTVFLMSTRGLCQNPVMAIDFEYFLHCLRVVVQRWEGRSFLITCLTLISALYTRLKTRILTPGLHLIITLSIKVVPSFRLFFIKSLAMVTICLSHVFNF